MKKCRRGDGSSTTMAASRMRKGNSTEVWKTGLYGAREIDQRGMTAAGFGGNKGNDR